MILYEYPFNERVRTYLRLEQLFLRLQELAERDTTLDHHFALTTLFEILEVGARADLKLDMLRDIERQKSMLEGLRDHPTISQLVLNRIIDKLDQSYSALQAQTGKTGQTLLDNDFLMGVRSRISIPGATGSFDLPAYHRWQHQPPGQRRSDLQRWMTCFAPLMDALNLLLGMLRDSGSPQMVASTNGQFQQSLPAGKPFQLLRLYIDPALGLVPEISANRLMVSVRLMRADGETKLQPTAENATFELTLCA